MSAPQTTLVLSTGQELDVEGTLEEVVKALENAARSSPGTLAQLTRSPAGTAIAVNPTQVIVARPSGEPGSTRGRTESLAAPAEGVE